jgi:hypothetical protein
MACEKTLENVERQCDVTQGIQSTIYIAYEEDVATIASPADGVIATITMTAGKVFHEIPVSTIISKNSITSELQGDDDGSSFLNKLTVFSPGVSGIKNLIMSDLRRPLGYIVIAVSKEGTKYVFGAKKDPARIKPGMSISDTVGHTLEIEHEAKNFPFELTGTIPLAS